MDPRDPHSWVPDWRPTPRQRFALGALRVGGRLVNRHPILLDYPPSDERPRWGWGSPPNRALEQLLARHADAFRATIKLIADNGRDLARIATADVPDGEPSWNQSWFTGLDAAALYSFIRTRQPARYHEVGAGYSTLFAARAIRDGALATRLFSVDPEPRADVDSVCDEMLRAPLQDCDPARVAAMEPGDVLLIDSSHYVLKNSDVVALILEILPALPDNVLVGIHDIFFPDDYPWWFNGRWYSEQYMLAAWLLGARDTVRVELASHYCSTEPALRRELEATWNRARLPGIPYGTTFWFET